MLNFQSIIILILFLLNIFFFKDFDHPGVVIFQVLSVIAVAVLLIRRESSGESRVDDAVEADVQGVPSFIEMDSVDPHHEWFDRILNLIQDIMNISGLFYFRYDAENAELVLDKGIARDAAFALKSRYPLDDRWPGLIGKSKRSLLTTEISDLSLMAYYTHIDQTRREFVGIPLLIDGHLEGVFTFDSTGRNEFSDEVISVLKQFVKLTAQHLSRPGDGPAEESPEISLFLSEFHELANQVYSETHFYELLKHLISKTFVAKNFFVTKSTDQREAHIVSILGSVEGRHLNDVFPLDEGIVGWSIKQRKFVHVPDLIHQNQFTVRFRQDEGKPARTRSIMVQPLVIDQICYGIGLEGGDANCFSEEDQRFLQDLREPLTDFLNHLQKRHQLTHSAIWDADRNGYSVAMLREMYKLYTRLSERYEIPFSLYTLRLSHAKYMNEAQSNQLFRYLCHEIRKRSRATDMLFVYNRNVLLMLSPFQEDTDESEWKQRLLTAVNGSRVLIDNQYVDPTLDIETVDLSESPEIDEILWKLHFHSQS